MKRRLATVYSSFTSDVQMRYSDWGARSARWSGIRSETVDVCGTGVHYLRADAGSRVRPGAPPQLLIHPLAAGGTFLLDLIRPLTAYGDVIAPDLPGSIFGHTGTPRVNAPRVEPNARFLRAFTDTLGLDRVILHGWSLGGAVALRFAAATDRVERLVLANPPLPARLTAAQWVGWQTLGRLAIAVGPAAARGLLRFWGRRAIDQKLRILERFDPSELDTMGGDPSRIAPENIELWTDQLAELRSDPSKMAYAATAFGSVVSGIFVNRRPVFDAIDRITAPVLLLWGAEDPLVERQAVDQVLARRPDWHLHVFASAGHAAPLEVPEEYVDVVGRWLGHGVDLSR
ncbi:MAG: alpha/beta fold hydrolase [Pseudonocardiaceae bacterium]|nr:alpha/beta fold hydrolase [Pseudonocardiaceae bacterium]